MTGAPTRALLLVEDNPGDVTLVQEAIGDDATIEITVAGNGKTAMAMLRQNGEYAKMSHPDLILLDLKLPNKSGLELLAELKGDAKLRRIPVIVFTSSELDRDISQAYDLHANCYVTKPPDLDGFMAAICSIRDFWLGTATLPQFD